MALGAIILTGGGSIRMGADKAALDWNGRSAVARAADLACAIGAVWTVTAGAGSYGLELVVEEPPGGGPVAGILAGATALRRARCDRALVLAVDAPTITAGDLQPLLDAPGPGAAFVGLHLPLVFQLSALPRTDGAGWSMGRFADQAGLRRIACPPYAWLRLRGANTPEERRILLAALVAAEGPGKGAS
jgi:molybdopterin-guanine dinucleotide biosynthesis protein A